MVEMIGDSPDLRIATIETVAADQITDGKEYTTLNLGGVHS